MPQIVESRPDRKEPELSVDRVTELPDDDMHSLCEAAHAAVIEGGGFGWVQPAGPPGARKLFPRRAARARAGVVRGPAQRHDRWLRPARAPAAQQRGAGLRGAAHARFIAPYTRGHGLGRLLVRRVEEGRALSATRCSISTCARRSTRRSRYIESMRYVRWGAHPGYARVGGRPYAASSTTSCCGRGPREDADRRHSPSIPRSTSRTANACGSGAAHGRRDGLFG